MLLPSMPVDEGRRKLSAADGKGNQAPENRHDPPPPPTVARPGMCSHDPFLKEQLVTAIIKT
jgi:hypothetical protein